MSKEEFCNRVYELVRQVPAGRVTTYGAVAKALGEPQSSRRVGYAMRISGQENTPIPAHRVVSSNGSVSCKSSKVSQFLENELVEIRNNKIVDFRTIFWAQFK